MRAKDTPARTSYDIVIVGGAIMGSATAWFLTDNPDFDGSVLVVERDPTYAFASTTHTNSCIRQQFSTELNVRISQFGADFVNTLRERMGGDERVPETKIQNFGYLYLAGTPLAVERLQEAHAVQVAAGAGTRLLSREELSDIYPFYDLDDILLGSVNTLNEGAFDGSIVFDWWRRQARERGVEYISNEVVGLGLNTNGSRIETVRLASGDTISCGQVVNASGPRAALTARMAGIEIPVEPRKRYSWVFTAEKPLPSNMPLTIDPSGVHVRQYGGNTYLAGGHSDPDPAVDYDDFVMDLALWESHVWPALATRIPQFEAIKVQNEWVGHYAYNTLDHNAIVGPHPQVKNFHFQNGFSGHGLQQSPAMGRGLSEMLIYGDYRSLDLSPFHFDRITEGRPFLEKAII